ncbi:acyl-CoA dehydrogenase family protein [Pseudonocardia sp. ICBG1122]|nr:acyl-CoA dehydrogenase family protein [Pseudonocardia pini]
MRALTPVVEEHREAGERDRRLPRPVVEALRSSGALRLYNPRELGGHELPVRAALGVMEQVGRLDVSVAWVLANATLGGLAALLPREGAARMWGEDPDVFIVNSTRSVDAAAGRAPGGWLLNGRWDLVTGLDVADWVGLLGTVRGEHAPSDGRAGDDPGMRMFFVRRSELAVVDTWDTVAMRMTGSATAVAHDVFVPDVLVLDPMAAPRIDRPLYRVPHFSSIGSLVAGALLGVTASALDQLADLVTTKAGGDGAPLADQHRVQATVGELGARVDAARLLLLDAAGDLDDTAEAGRPITLGQRGRMRSAMSLVAVVSRAALAAVYEQAGSTVLYRGGRLERTVRDGLAAAQHGNLDATHFAVAGRIALGRESVDMHI